MNALVQSPDTKQGRDSLYPPFRICPEGSRRKTKENSKYYDGEGGEYDPKQ